MSADKMVEIAHLSHRYGAHSALDDVSLSVDGGSIFAILGPNGGGKTTLFKILSTQLTPLSGTARIAGADVVAQRDRVRAILGIVFQHPSLDDKLSVLENLRHQGHLYGLSGASLRERSMELLQRFGVADRAGDRVDKLSGGLQRRVELAKALLHRPRVLILDEPSTGLDPGARMTLFDSLTTLKKEEGVTTLLTTHLMDEAERCDRLAILHRGKVAALDSPAALKRMIGGDVLTLTTGDPNSLRAKVTERFDCSCEIVDNQLRIERERGHEFVPAVIEAFPGEIDSVTVGKPTLDDVFVHLTGQRLEGDEGYPRSRGESE